MYFYQLLYTFFSSSLLSTRYVSKQLGLSNKSSILYIYNLEPIDEGTYSCVAENVAGTAEANLSLVVLYRERSTVEPTYDQPTSGYMAVIAAVVLTGSLCMLGCMIGAIVFCVKRKRDQKRHLKSLVSQNKTIMPIVKEGVGMAQQRKQAEGTELTFEHQQRIMYAEQQQQQQHQQMNNIGGGPGGNNNASLSNVDSCQPKHHQANIKETSSYRNSSSSNNNPSSAAKYHLSTTEPDLINEVQGGGGGGCATNDTSYTLYQSVVDRPPSVQLAYHPMQQPPDLQQQQRTNNNLVSRVSYLDHDGYPANYGLPKMPFNNACTLPRLRYRIPDGTSSSASASAASAAMSAVPSPTARYSREAEIIVRSNAYDAILPRTDPRFTADGYPYPAYRTLNKHQLQQMSISGAAAAGASANNVVAGASSSSSSSTRHHHRPQEQGATTFPPRPLSPPAAYRGGEPAATPLSPRSLLNKSAHEAAPTRAEDNFPVHHPESPDEGYVGDAMDV